MCVAVDSPCAAAGAVADELEYVRGRFRSILTELNRGKLLWKFQLPRTLTEINPLLASLQLCTYEQLSFLGDLACYIHAPNPRQLDVYRERILDRLRDPRCPRIALTAFLEAAADVDDAAFREHWRFLAP